jgi:endonuclease/exonuclease/phosphatase family metal-dependent hydrolase
MTRTYEKVNNDKLSGAIEDLVPPCYRGTDKFIDLVTWNIRYFHDRDEERVDKISHIMNALNADIFVLEEILAGSLDIVAEKLKQFGAGHYKSVYGTTGGDQRVAMLYDLDWIRAKDDIKELFEKGQFKVNGKDAFPRLPLHGYFTGLTRNDTEPFDFQLVGIHLKSQRGEDSSTIQRATAAKELTNWLSGEALKIDSDVIIVGDWNEPPDASTWEPFAKLEEKGDILFRTMNDNDDISHLMYRSRKEFGTRLDLSLVTIASANELVDKKASAVRWQSLDDLLSKNPDAGQIKQYIQDISNSISDHMPVVTRFYFEEKDCNAY